MASEACDSKLAPRLSAASASSTCSPILTRVFISREGSWMRAQHTAACSSKSRAASYSPPSHSSSKACSTESTAHLGPPWRASSAAPTHLRAVSSSSWRCARACDNIAPRSRSKVTGPASKATRPGPESRAPRQERRDAPRRASTRASFSALKARTCVDIMLARLCMALPWRSFFSASARALRAFTGSFSSIRSSACAMATSPKNWARRQTSTEVNARRRQVLHTCVSPAWQWQSQGKCESQCRRRRRASRHRLPFHSTHFSKVALTFTNKVND